VTVKGRIEQRRDTKDAGAMARVIQQVWNATWVYTGNERRVEGDVEEGEAVDCWSGHWD
jgi:hypothetical protein